MRVASTNLHTARVFSHIIHLSIIGLAVFMFVVWAQRRFVFWQKSSAILDTCIGTRHATLRACSLIAASLWPASRRLYPDVLVGSPRLQCLVGRGGASDRKTV